MAVSIPQLTLPATAFVGKFFKYLGWVKSNGTLAAVNEDAPLPVSVLSSSGGAAANSVTAQVLISHTTGTTVVNGRPTRKRVIVQNLDPTNFVWIIGNSGSISSAGSLKLAPFPNGSVEFRAQGGVTALADTADVTVAVTDEYD